MELLQQNTIIRSIFRLRVPKTESTTIYCLDDSLLTPIYQYLPLVDQVCMALSCKRFLSCYKVVAKDSSMLPPQPTENHLPLSYVNSQDKLRVRLLVRLENLQWAYCAECLSLKSRKLFTPDALNASALERHCSRYDGVIQLCPCLHLTRRDRNNVRLLLRSPVTPRGEFRYGISALNVTGGDLLAIPVHYFQAKIERCEPARKLLSPIWLLGLASLVYSDSILW